MGRGRSGVGAGGGGGIGAGIGIGGGAGGGIPGILNQNAAPPNVKPGQAAPAITIAQFQSMNDTEFVNYLNALKSTPINQRMYYNSDWDTQRLIANMPELNKAPQVVDPATFASLPGQSLFRTVNQSGQESAVQICGRTMSSDVTTIGSGRMGDGFYFATSKSVSQNGYGNHSNDIYKTATMEVKLNSNAKIITESQLQNMLLRESPSVQRAVRNMRSDGQWGGSGYAAYALHKGYNVVSANGVVNIIDRNAAVWSGQITPKP